MPMSSLSIAREIREVQSEINVLSLKLEKYSKLLSDVSKTAPLLSSAVSYSKSASNEIPSYFVLDDERADQSEIEYCKEKIDNEYQKINNSVIPAIKSKIKELEEKIRLLKIKLLNLERAYEQALREEALSSEEQGTCFSEL